MAKDGAGEGDGDGDGEGEEWEKKRIDGGMGLSLIAFIAS